MSPENGSLIMENTNVLNSSIDNAKVYKMTLGTVRTVVAPYLPPPVLNTMAYIDSNPNMKSLGDEPSMLILSAIVTIFLFGKGFKIISFLLSGKAIEGLDDDESPEGNVLDNLDNQNKTKGDEDVEYDDSVVLFGPNNGGKTVLFYNLLSNSNKRKEGSIPFTIMSLKANVSYINEGTCENKKIRLIDYPGHITLSSQLASLLYPSSKSGQIVRALLVVDSTKVVSEAASLLYNFILTNKPLIDAWERKNEVLQVMVVCNKADAANAKNWRRIKIQLRAELEKLKKISSSVSSSSGADLQGINEEKRPMTGKNIDLDNLTKNGLAHVKISFSACSCVSGEGNGVVSAFVTHGEVMTDNSSILTQRKDGNSKKSMLI